MILCLFSLNVFFFIFPRSLLGSSFSCLYRRYTRQTRAVQIPNDRRSPRRRRQLLIGSHYQATLLRESIFRNKTAHVAFTSIYFINTRSNRIPIGTFHEMHYSTRFSYGFTVRDLRVYLVSRFKRKENLLFTFRVFVLFSLPMVL